jgi:hypothetical protein
VSRSLDLSDDLLVAFDGSLDLGQDFDANFDLLQRGSANDLHGRLDIDGVGGSVAANGLSDRFDLIGLDGAGSAAEQMLLGTGDFGQSAPQDGSLSELEDLFNDRFAARASGGEQLGDEDYVSWDSPFVGPSSTDDVGDWDRHMPGQENSRHNQAHRHIEENNGIGLLGAKETLADPDPSDPRVSTAEATNRLEDIRAQYKEESKNSSLSAEAQIEYIDEQLRTIKEYEDNPSQPISSEEQQDLDMAKNNLEAQREVLLEAIKPPPPREAMPPSSEDTGAPDVPVTPEEPEDDPEEDPDSPPEDEPGLAMPNPIDDPQPTGNISDIFTKGPGARNPNTTRPPIEIDTDGLTLGDVSDIFTKGPGARNPATTTPLPIEIDDGGLTNGDISALFTQGARNPGNTTPVPFEIDSGFSGDGPAVIDIDLDEKFAGLGDLDGFDGLI